MALQAKKTFTAKVILLDAHVFVDCTFNGCILQYAGEVTFDQIFRGKTELFDSVFDLVGAAANVLHFMVDIDKFYPEVTDGWIRQIKEHSHNSFHPLAERHQGLKELE